MNELFRVLHRKVYCAAFGLAAGLVAGASIAAPITLQPSITGVTAGIYKGPAPLLSGAFQTQASLSLAGKYITVPASARVAANAASFVVSAARVTNPLILGAAVLGWFLAADIEPDGLGGWRKVGSAPLGDVVQTGAIVYYSLGGYPYTGCSALASPYTFSIREGDHACCYGEPAYCVQPHGSCSTGVANYVTGDCHELADGGTAATDDDFAPLIAAPLPDSVADEVAETMGVPVSPEIMPGDVSLGSPYAKPDGSTWQRRARLTPNPDGTVTAVPYEIQVTEPLPDYVPDTEAQPTGGQEVNDDCSTNPGKLGCVELGDPSIEQIPTDAFSFDYEPLNLFGSGTCPDFDAIEVGGMQLNIFNGPQACGYITDYVRPIVILLSTFAATFILFGVGRSS